MDTARNFFESFISVDSLKEAKKNKQSEGLYLEFKEKSNSTHPNLDYDDKKNFADCLSQFANSDGGVLIWGVKTKKKPIDIIQSFKSIVLVDTFKSNLMNFLKDAAQPPVDNVEFESLYSDKRHKNGFLKILIPSSDKTPHRSMISREYLKRSAQGKYKLEHFDLEDMFGRRQRPLLHITLDFTQYPNSADPDIHTLKFSLMNIGRAMADHCGFFLKLDDNIQLISISDPTIIDVTTHNNGIPAISYENNINVIHPNNINYNIGHIRFKKRDNKKQSNCYLTYYCNRMQTKKEEIII